jgi:hypothetical protein
LLEQTQLAGDERQRLSREAEQAALAKLQQAAMRRAAKLEPEVPVSEQKIDADMRKLAETLAQHIDLLDRLSAELRVAGTDRDLALRPWAVPAALAHHLSACDVGGLVDLPPITGGPRPLVEAK